MRLNKYIKLFLVSFIVLSIHTAKANEELVLKNDPSYVPNFESKYALVAGVNPSFKTTTDITNFSITYGKKMSDFWLDSTLNITNGMFNKLTTNNYSATKLTDAQLLGSKSTLTTFGVGVGRETNYAQTLFPIINLNEYIAANLTYNFFKESVSSKSFTGPGLIAKYSLYKRFSDYLSFGPQFTYNLAVVKRSADNDSETSSARSLTISNLTVGFELSLFL